MEEYKAKRAGKKPALRVAHRNDRAAVTRWMAGQGQALLPMLELLENAQASVDELMNEAARAFIEQLLMMSAQGKRPATTILTARAGLVQRQPALSFQRCGSSSSTRLAG